MNGRQIHGFYYDTEKKKYFAIQPHHKAPQGAKHSKDNVRREERDAKKRKVDQERLTVLQQQTVQRSKVLQSSVISGIGLHRELGASLDHCKASRESALARQLGPKQPVLESSNDRGTLYDVVHLEHTGQSIVAMGYDWGQTSTLFACDLDSLDSQEQPWTSSNAYRLAAFNSQITSLTLSTAGLIVATCLEPSHPGNVYLGCSDMADPSSGPTGTCLRLGNDETSLWCSASQPSARGQHAAIGSSDSVYLLDVIGSLTSRLSMNSECRALDWLSYNVIAAGKSSGKSHDVKLWDVRTRGSSARFKHNNPITGVRSADNVGQRLLVTSHDRMSLYDVRAGKKALLSIQHAHVGPRCVFDTFDLGGTSAVAALDSENEVHVYSVRTGKHLHGFGRPDKPFEWTTKIRCGTNSRGSPGLSACQGVNLFQWNFGGIADDES